MQSTNPPIQSVDRALRLLWEIRANPDVTLTKLSQRLSLLPSTATRLIATLEHHGLVERDPVSRGYRIGAGALYLSSQFTEPLDLQQRLAPVMEQLADHAAEQVTLGVLNGDACLHIFSIDGASRAGYDLILSRLAGRRDLNLNATALGKVLLAYLPESELDRRLSRMTLEATTPKTITDHEEFAKHLALVCQQGYALSIEENVSHVRGAAVPIQDAHGHVVAAIAIAGPAIRLTDDRLRTLIPHLLLAGQAGSAAMGLVRSEGGVTHLSA